MSADEQVWGLGMNLTRDAAVIVSRISTDMLHQYIDFLTSETKNLGIEQAKVAAAAPAPGIEAKTAPGTAGEVKRFGVPDKEAAMIMAIVADQMGRPLNELRFKSIKEVK